MAPRNSPILLIDLPTFPKGTVALSLYAVAAALGDSRSIRVIDLNFQGLEDAIAPFRRDTPPLLGLKVSAQNFHLAVEYSQTLREHFPDTPILWGGEYPTLEPDQCLPG